jgi:hypothetical protein
VVSLVYPIARYGCTRFECEWVGNLAQPVRTSDIPVGYEALERPTVV